MSIVTAAGFLLYVTMRISVMTLAFDVNKIRMLLLIMSSVIMSPSHNKSLHTHYKVRKQTIRRGQSSYSPWATTTNHTHSENTPRCQLVRLLAGSSVSAGSADIRSEPPPKTSSHKQQASAPAHFHMQPPLIARGHCRDPRCVSLWCTL